ncbi:MAG: hypothetical protein JFR38_03150 [Muribaculaceae bacterium]|nr:hypothetical protein [Muribaculaceae bacterium]
MEIDNRLIEYANRAEEITPQRALDILIDIYIDNCGISAGERSLADYASEYWREKLSETMPQVAECDYFEDVMDLLSERFRANREEITKYDIDFLSDEGLQEVCKEFIEFSNNEEANTAVCAGVVDFIKKY